MDDITGKATRYFQMPEKVKERLRTLPCDQQAHIAEKYYFGFMPWYETEDNNGGVFRA